MRIEDCLAPGAVVLPERVQHNAHVHALMDRWIGNVLALLLPIGCPDGWAEWSASAARGEWS